MGKYLNSFNQDTNYLSHINNPRIGGKVKWIVWLWPNIDIFPKITCKINWDFHSETKYTLICSVQMVWTVSENPHFILQRNKILLNSNKSKSSNQSKGFVNHNHNCTPNSKSKIHHHKVTTTATKCMFCSTFRGDKIIIDFDMFASKIDFNLKFVCLFGFIVGRAKSDSKHKVDFDIFGWCQLEIP